MATPKKPQKPARKAARPPVINLKATEVKSAADKASRSTATPTAKKAAPASKSAPKKPDPKKPEAPKPAAKKQPEAKKADTKTATEKPKGPKPQPKRKSAMGRNAVLAAIALLVAGGGYLALQNPGIFSPAAKQAQTAEQTETIVALKARIDALEKAVANNAPKAADKNNAAAATKRIGELETKLAETQKTLSALKAILESATANGTEGPDKAIAANKLRLDGLDTALKDMTAAIEKARTDLASAASKQAETQSKSVADLKTELGQISKSQGDLKTAIEALKTQMKTMAAAPRVGPTDRLARSFTVLRAKVLSGAPFLSELDEVAKVLPGAPALDTLRAHAETGVKTLPQLTTALTALKQKTANADTAAKSDGIFGQVKQKFSGLVKVRKVGEVNVEKHLAEAKTALKSGDITSAANSLTNITDTIVPGIADWKKSANAHLASTKALNTLTSLVAARVAQAKP